MSGKQWYDTFMKEIEGVLLTPESVKAAARRAALEPENPIAQEPIKQKIKKEPSARSWPKMPHA